MYSHVPIIEESVTKYIILFCFIPHLTMITYFKVIVEKLFTITLCITLLWNGEKNTQNRESVFKYTMKSF